MKVSILMARDVKRCAKYCTLNTAADIMWGYDIGCLPIVDDENRVVGMLTDRDICMSGYLQGKPLSHALVAEAMSKEIYFCHPDDDIKWAEKIMLEKQVHRLPVVDEQQTLIGLITLSDLARESARQAELGRPREVTGAEITEVIATIHTPRRQATAARAA